MSKTFRIVEQGVAVRIELRNHPVVLVDGVFPGNTRRARFHAAAQQARNKLREMKAEAARRIALDTALLYMPVRTELGPAPF